MQIAKFEAVVYQSFYAKFEAVVYQSFKMADNLYFFFNFHLDRHSLPQFWIYFTQINFKKNILTNQSSLKTKLYFSKTKRLFVVVGGGGVPHRMSDEMVTMVEVDTVTVEAKMVCYRMIELSLNE